jgi:hypothetical protein
MIETCRPLLFDDCMWTPGGILIYYVDENAEGSGNKFCGFLGQSGWPGNGNHYEVALLQRNGLYELEKALNSGHADDFWLPRLDLSLGPGNGESIALSNGVYPNTDSSAFGIIKTTVESLLRILRTNPAWDQVLKCRACLVQTLVARCQHLYLHLLRHQSQLCLRLSNGDT